MIEKQRHIPELFYLKTKWNNNPNRHFPWEDNMLKKTLSNNMFNNPNMSEYLLQLEQMISLLVESVNVIRNFFNISVNKYYNDHTN